MSQQRGRAYRRHQRNRWRKRVSKYIANEYLWEHPNCAPTWYERPVYTEQEIARRIGMSEKTRRPCACNMCRNPRKEWGERPLDEKVADLNEVEQLMEEGLYDGSKGNHIRFGQYYS